MVQYGQSAWSERNMSRSLRDTHRTIGKRAGGKRAGERHAAKDRQD